MVKQILPKAGQAILDLFSKLGGNMNNVLGSRSNVTFLGKGKNPEGFIDSDINVEAIGFLGKNKILEELESSIGYLTAGKLNDVQANKLYENMLKVDEVFNPKQIANITDMATGTRDLTQEGLGALRAAADDLPPRGSRGGPDDIAAPVQDAETTIRNLEAQDPELAAQFRAMMIGGNQGGTPAKRATAREFLVEALKKENPNQTSLADVIDEVDVHMHPSHQFRFVKLLSQAFPKIQFICSTHSPHIIQGATENSVVLNAERNIQDGTMIQTINDDSAHLLFVSPLLDLKSIHGETLRSSGDVATQDFYQEIIEYNHLMDIVKNPESEKIIPKHWLED